MNHIRRAAAAVFGGGGKNKPNKGIIRNDMPVSSQDDDHDSDDDDDDDDAPLHGRQSERGDIEQQQQPPQHTSKGRRHRGGRRALRERHTDSMRRRHEQYFSTRRSLSGGGGADFYIPSRRVVLPKMKQRETNATKQQQYQPVVVTSSFSGDNNQRTSTNSTEKEKTKNKNHHSGPVVSNESTPLIRPLPTTPKTYSPSQRPQRRQSSSASDRSSNASSSSSESSDDRPVIAFPFLPGRKEQHQQATASSPKNRYWATLKKQVHQGTFLVSEVLSKDSELLDMDDEKGIGGGNVNGITFYNGSNNHKKGNKNSNKSVEELRQRAIENFQKGSTFSPQLCLLAIFIYLIIAVFMFCFLLEPQWTVIDSCYFAVSTFTTLGYGDLAPTSTISVIFTTVYALAGVACLGLALGILGSKLLETKEDRRRHEDFSSEYAALTLFDRDDDWSSTAPSTAADDYPYDSDDDCGYFEAVSDDDDEKEGTNEKPTSGRHSGSGASSKNVTFDGSIKNGSMDSRRERNSNGQKSASRPSSEAGSSTCSKDNRQSAKKIDSRTTYPVGYIRFVILLTITMIFAFLIGYSSGWGFWSTVYYTVTTAATIGRLVICRRENVLRKAHVLTPVFSLQFSR